MTRPDHDDTTRRAAEWHAGLDSPDMDWAAFGDWLEADPAHRDAYDAIALLDAEVAELRPRIGAALPANDPGEPEEAPRRQRRWWAGGGAVLAIALAVLITPQLGFPGGEPMVAYRTGPGETRLIPLGDGSRILLDRNSQLALADGASPRVEIASGGAFFDIRHDPSRVMVIKAGDYEVRDIGTRFDVAVDRRHMSVAVAEGKVTVAPKDGDGTPLIAGERIDIAAGEARVSPVQATDIGAWRRGQLVYRETPLALVAVDLTRYGRRRVSVDPAVGEMRMSGVLTIGDGSQLVEQIEAVLPVRAVAAGDDLRLVGRAPR